MTARALPAARVLLALCAFAAAAAAVGAVPVAADAAPATQWLEVWRACGFATFAVLFAVLAVRPAASPGVWVAVLANKATLTVTALVLDDVPGARQAIGWDSALTALLLLAGVGTLVGRRADARAARVDVPGAARELAAA